MKGYKDVLGMLSAPKEFSDRDQEMPTINYELYYMVEYSKGENSFF